MMTMKTMMRAQYDDIYDDDENTKYDDDDDNDMSTKYEMQAAGRRQPFDTATTVQTLLENCDV